MNKGKKIIFAVVLLIVLVGGFIILSVKQRSDRIKKLEIAYVEMVKASVNLYRVAYGTYPYDAEVLIRDLEVYAKTERVQPDLKEGMSDSIKSTKKAVNELKDFDFSLRGDGEAYQITYTDFEGNKKVIEGNYNKEFH